MRTEKLSSVWERKPRLGITGRMGPWTGELSPLSELAADLWLAATLPFSHVIGK
jgi:hypothetical protein